MGTRDLDEQVDKARRERVDAVEVQEHERAAQLADEIERLRALLRQHGIEPQDKPA
jgi:protein-arginine kinase activator protein McsA